MPEHTLLSYRLEKTAGEPLYIQLCGRIQADIVSGTLPPGSKLPSKRAFAANLGVSLITVESAYAQLRAEGFIEASPRRGYFVAGAVPPFPAPKKEGAPFLQALPCPPPGLTDLSANAVYAPGFPYATWAKLMRRVLTQTDPNELVGRTPGKGVYALRLAVSRHLKDFSGITADPEQIVLGAGTQVLYGLLIKLLGAQRVYAVEDPGYAELAEIYRLSGALLRRVPVDDKGVLPEALALSGASVLHATPSHQFPTGAVMSAERKMALLSWVRAKPGRHIIEDDYDSEFKLKGRPFAPLASMDAAGRVIYVNTFTKTLAPSLRVSYMVLPASLALEFDKKLGFYASTVSTFEQFTLALFISGGYFARHILRMKKRYLEKRDLSLSLIREKNTLGKFKVLSPYDGLHFLLSVRTARSDRLLREEIRKSGISVKFISDFEAGATSDTHTLILSEAGLDEKTLRAGLGALLDILNRAA